jgi:hypothetical protein
MKNNPNNRLNAYKSSHKSKQKSQDNLETGIPNTDVLGMQEVNQATNHKTRTPRAEPIGSKTGKNNVKKGNI